MTEIKIEKKKTIWPWLLLLLLLGIIAVVWLYFFRYDKRETMETADNKALIDVRENNSTVAAYVIFINSDTNKMSLDHAYSREALTNLTDAVDAMATEAGYDVNVDISKAKQYAQEITKDPLYTTHADKNTLKIKI